MENSPLPLQTADLPLVSILIRSMGRELLAEALDSVAMQTYPNIEVVVIDALAKGHRQLPASCGRFPLRFIAAETPRPRSLAANVGLENAVGKYILFLDDDDRIYPDHIEKLAVYLEGCGHSLAAYTGVSAVDRAGKEILSFTLAPPCARLLLSNYMPIHAVLFNQLLVSQYGCRFDLSLDTYEDWDFWLQLGQYTDFDFIPGISALYVIDTSPEHLVHDPVEMHCSAERIYAKWTPISNAKKLHHLRGYVQDIENKLSTQTLEITQLNREKSDIEMALKNLSSELTAMHQSMSWRITTPLRRLKAALMSFFRL